VRAFEYLHSFDSEKGAMRTWLGGIARNMINTYYTKNAKDAKIIEISEFIPADTDIEGQYLQDEDIKRVMSEVKKLPEHHRELLAMKYMLGLTSREIAEATGKSESSVKVTIHRTIAGLRKNILETM
jgi:RNA polymerase sigma-70 factor (ECF subfamily)